MQAEFWHQMWASKDIGFHEGQVNDFLVRYFARLGGDQQQRVMVPLCGKTIDIHWLLSQGHRVVGAELNQSAVDELFSELGLTPEVSQLGKLLKYTGVNIEVYVGDIFELTRETLGAVDVIYDRAALVALPESMCTDYARHLVAICDNAPQLLIVYEYDENLMDGPPFSVNQSKIERLYDSCYSISRLDHREADGGIRGVAATELVWQLGQYCDK